MAASKRRLHVGRIADRLRGHDWFALGLELLVVVVGILLALQVDGWAERRKELQLERTYLDRLREDLEIEVGRMNVAEHVANRRMEAVRFLDQLARDPALPKKEPQRVAWALETASWRSYPQINAYVYRELQATGRLVLIRSESLRRSLAEHYTILQHEARVGEDLSAQQRFDAAVTGLLDIDELAAIELAGGEPDAIPMTAERALAVAAAFRSRPAALAELPALVQHHTFNVRVIKDMRRRAEAITGMIDALLADRSGP